MIDGEHLVLAVVFLSLGWPGAGKSRARWINSPMSRFAPAVGKNKFVQGASAHRAVTALGFPRVSVQATNTSSGIASSALTGFGGPVKAGDDASIAEAPGSQQQVLHRGVYRCTLHGVWRSIANQAGQNQRRYVGKMTDVFAHGAGHTRFWGIGIRAGTFRVAIVAFFLAPDLLGGTGDEAGLGCFFAVSQDDKPKRLAVGATGCTRC